MEMRSYNKDRALEDRFAKTIKAILGNQFIIKDDWMDKKEGTDFIVYSITSIKVAVRLRRFDYIKYKNEFTLRWSRPSGVKTEYQKIKEGLVDFILYGFIDLSEKSIIHYFIGDLTIFRKANIKPYLIKPNNPYDSELAIFRLSDCPNGFIIKLYEA